MHEQSGGNDLSHLGENEEGTFPKDTNTHTEDIWGWICIQYDINSVLDIGCGLGYNLAWFKEYGFEILGVEGHPWAVKETLVPGAVEQHDFTKGPWKPGKAYDLCVCTEFAEHVEAEFEENWLVAIEMCKYLLISGAIPGQGGHHHVNEQPNEYWIEKFTRRGYCFDAAVSARLRETCSRKPALWGRNQLMFFYRS